MDAGVVARVEEPVAFSPAQERQVGQWRLGVGGDAFQQGFEPSEHPVDRARVEQVGAVLEGGVEALIGLGQLECEVELGRIDGRLEDGHRQPGGCEWRQRCVLKDEHGLEQGGPAGVAFCAHCLDDLLEGEVLMREGVEDDWLGLSEELPEAQLS